MAVLLELFECAIVSLKMSNRHDESFVISQPKNVLELNVESVVSVPYPLKFVVSESKSSVTPAEAAFATLLGPAGPSFNRPSIPCPPLSTKVAFIVVSRWSQTGPLPLLRARRNFDAKAFGTKVSLSSAIIVAINLNWPFSQTSWPANDDNTTS